MQEKFRDEVLGERQAEEEEKHEAQLAREQQMRVWVVRCCVPRHSLCTCTRIISLIEVRARRTGVSCVPTGRRKTPSPNNHNTVPRNTLEIRRALQNHVGTETVHSRNHRRTAF